MEHSGKWNGMEWNGTMEWSQMEWKEGMEMDKRTNGIDLNPFQMQTSFIRKKYTDQGRMIHIFRYLSGHPRVAFELAHAANTGARTPGGRSRPS